MPKSGYKGISFPFRTGLQGGVVMSTTSVTDSTHIRESIQQIFGTNYLERAMEPEVYSSVSLSLFEPNDESLQSILRSRIVNDIGRLEERVTLSEDNIEFSVEDTLEREGILYVTLTYKINKYETWYTEKFKVGDLNE